MAEEQKTLEEIIAQLAKDEREVLRLIASRLLDGQALYGKLDASRDSRCWPAEMRAEALDLIIYRFIAKIAGQQVDVGDALRRTHERCDELLDEVRTERAENLILRRQLEEMSQDAIEAEALFQLDEEDDEPN